MAVITIPSTATEQPTQSQSMDSAGSTGMQRAFKDTYARLKTWADSLSVGDTLGGDVFKSYSLVRNRCAVGMSQIVLNGPSPPR